MTAPPAARTFGWGLFCACSWTWCIGMFLPVLMIDRYGWPGFLVFAIPNVLGCAGFGYVLMSRAHSEAMARAHKPAMIAFSLVAIAFHMFFVPLLLTELLAPAGEQVWVAPVLTSIVFLLGLVISRLPDRSWLWLAVLTWVFSVSAFAMIGFEAWPRLMEPGREELRDLLWLAPIIGLGFLLCPYLDLTFHRARQQSPSRHAFAVFGVAFTVMIVFTCFLWPVLRNMLPVIGVGHILAQIVFTVGAHMREVREGTMSLCGHRRIVIMLMPLLGLAAYYVGRQFAGGVDLYLRFFVFYGLAFPAYVVLFIGPWRPASLSKPALIALGLVILLLAPLYELAFLHDFAWLLIVPTALVVVWGLIRIRRGPVAATINPPR